MEGCHCSFVKRVKPGQADVSGIKQEREASSFCNNTQKRRLQ
jgi:hypothetical protein